MDMQVAGLSDVASLIPVLQALGKRHANYGVESAHFAVVGEALIWTLADGLGDKFTPEVRGLRGECGTAACWAGGPQN
jgi:hemoglobin-like flavoprotein